MIPGAMPPQYTSPPPHLRPLYREDGTIERAGLWETPRWYKDDPDAPSVLAPEPTWDWALILVLT